MYCKGKTTLQKFGFQIPRTLGNPLKYATVAKHLSVLYISMQILDTLTLSVLNAMMRTAVP